MSFPPLSHQFSTARSTRIGVLTAEGGSSTSTAQCLYLFNLSRHFEQASFFRLFVSEGCQVCAFLFSSSSSSIAYLTSTFYEFQRWKFDDRRQFLLAAVACDYWDTRYDHNCLPLINALLSPISRAALLCRHHVILEPQRPRKRSTKKTPVIQWPESPTEAELIGQIVSIDWYCVLDCSVEG